MIFFSVRTRGNKLTAWYNPYSRPMFASTALNLNFHMYAHRAFAVQARGNTTRDEISALPSQLYGARAYERGKGRKRRREDRGRICRSSRGLESADLRRSVARFAQRFRLHLDRTDGHIGRHRFRTPVNYRVYLWPEMSTTSHIVAAVTRY